MTARIFIAKMVILSSPLLSTPHIGYIYKLEVAKNAEDAAGASAGVRQEAQSGQNDMRATMQRMQQLAQEADALRQVKEWHPILQDPINK